MIIEAALLSDEEKVTACTLAKAAGADFVKTSTGFGPGGATVADVALMRRVVGDSMGVKAAGGVRDLGQVQAMVAAGASRVGASAGVRIVRESAAPGAAGAAPRRPRADDRRAARSGASPEAPVTRLFPPLAARWRSRPSRRRRRRSDRSRSAGSPPTSVGVTTSLPTSEGWTPTSLVATSLVPGRGFGAAAGLHVVFGPGRHHPPRARAGGPDRRGEATGTGGAPR